MSYHCVTPYVQTCSPQSQPKLGLCKHLGPGQMEIVLRSSHFKSSDQIMDVVLIGEVAAPKDHFRFASIRGF